MRARFLVPILAFAALGLGEAACRNRTAPVSQHDTLMAMGLSARDREAPSASGPPSVGAPPPAPAAMHEADRSTDMSAHDPSASAGTKREAEENGCPAEMTRSAHVCIDRYEAHLVTRALGGGVSVMPYYERPAAGVVFEARSERDTYPQAYISRVEATDACRNAGKRLCSLNEWQRACSGARTHPYPYGDAPKARRCNNGKPHLLTRLFSADPSRWSYDEHFNNPQLDQTPGFLAKAGEYEGCVSEDGAFDMVGNLHEWVSDTVDEALVSRLTSDSRSRHMVRAGNGIFAGGFFSTTDENGIGCRFTTYAHEPAYHDYSTGFRCCRDPAQ